MNLQQITLLVSQTAKGGAGMVHIAGQCVTAILENLKLVRDLKMNRVTATLNVAPGGFGPFPLPADYLRTYDMSYPLQTPNGTTQFLTLITMEQWDQEFKGILTADYPYEFATDLSTQAQVWSGGSQGNGTLTSAGNVFIYPASNGQLAITHRYMRNQPDYSLPETNTLAPWFPFSQYLIEAASAMMMGVTGDSRKKEFEDRSEALLHPYLIQEGDEQTAIKEVKLDPRRFHSPRAVRPTKTQPY